MKKRKTILIVDDDRDDFEFICEAVTEIDTSIECLMAKSGEDALNILRNNVKQLPDHIFLDLNLPRMDGKTCLAELKKDKKLKNIPVIIYTTSSHQKDIDETRALGATYFLTKPTDFSALYKEILFVMKSDWSQHSGTANL